MKMMIRASCSRLLRVVTTCHNRLPSVFSYESPTGVTSEQLEALVLEEKPLALWNEVITLQVPPAHSLCLFWDRLQDAWWKFAQFWMCKTNYSKSTSSKNIWWFQMRLILWPCLAWFPRSDVFFQQDQAANQKTHCKPCHGEFCL